MARGIIALDHSPSIMGYAAVAGKKEGEGPLGKNFDVLYKNSLRGEKTFEKAESAMQKEACTLAISKSHLTPEQIDIAFAGDLLNQCVGSSYGLRDLEIPFVGLYGACSTMAEGIALAAMNVEAKYANYALAATSSHFCSAERQFRFPLEYGGQRPQSSQWTATAAGAVVVGPNKKPPYVKQVCVGTVTDLGIKDINNMGGAMAPAAAHTLLKFFNETNTGPKQYDLIVTGDLGAIGSRMLVDLMKLEGVDITQQHQDCGLLLFDRNKQDVHSGGSGCGCSAAVLCSTLLKNLEQGMYHDILFMATGALMSTVTNQQGESIPGIAHLVHLSDHK